jgi:hypothetical protein
MNNTDDDNAKKKLEPKPRKKRIAKRGSERNLPIPLEVDGLPDPEGELRTLKATDLVEFNRIAECEFVRIVLGLMGEYGAVRVREVCIEAAYRLDISIETAKRYLLKHSAFSAQFSIEKGWVRERVKNKRK